MTKPVLLLCLLEWQIDPPCRAAFIDHAAQRVWSGLWLQFAATRFRVMELITILVSRFSSVHHSARRL
jgi:hypothetical protein